jgi:hypothetical protein
LLISLILSPFFTNNYNKKYIITQGKIIEKKEYENSLYLEKNQFSNILELKTKSGYEYGYNWGLKFRVFYLLLFFMEFQISNSIKEKIYHTNDLKQIYKTYHPEYLEELHGLSNSTRIPFNTLFNIQILIFNMCNQQCTLTLSTNHATKNNETFLTQNWDFDILNPFFYLLRYFFSRILFQSTIQSFYSYIFIGIPVLYEYPLLNEKGLGWGGAGTHLTKNNSRIIDQGNGISPYLLVRNTMMKCRNVSEVAILWENSLRSSFSTYLYHPNWDYDTYAWCDKNGGILMIEQTHSYIVSIFENPSQIDDYLTDILSHSNHHIWLNPYQTGSIIPGEDQRANNSYLRFKRAYEILIMYYGNITIDVCKNLTRDHFEGTINNFPDSSDICRHADSNDSYATAISWIIQPRNYTIYLSNTAPCQGNFKVYDCTKLFDRKF